MGVPLILIVGVVAIAIVVELFSEAIFDFDANTAYRSVFGKLDEMVAEIVRHGKEHCVCAGTPAESQARHGAR